MAPTETPMDVHSAAILQVVTVANTACILIPKIVNIVVLTALVVQRTVHTRILTVVHNVAAAMLTTPAAVVRITPVP